VNRKRSILDAIQKDATALKKNLPTDDQTRLEEHLSGIRDLERAIAALPDGARDVYVLHDVHGYTHREIAELMGIVEGTSKSQLNRARSLLRMSLP